VNAVQNLMRDRRCVRPNSRGCRAGRILVMREENSSPDFDCSGSTRHLGC